MRSIALAAVILAATPVEAAACHRYAIWHFPWRQRCIEPARYSRPGGPSAVRPSFHLPRPDGRPEPSVGLGDPTLTDEEVRARLMLRAAMENAR